MGWTRPAGSPAPHGGRGDRLAPGADDDQLVDVQSRQELADPVVLLRRERAQLGHLAEHGHPSPVAGHRARGPERRGHRGRIGVVGVVHDVTPSAVRTTCMRPPDTVASFRASAAAAGSTPSVPAAAAAASASGTICSPGTCR